MTGIHVNNADNFGIHINSADNFGIHLLVQFNPEV